MQALACVIVVLSLSGCIMTQSTTVEISEHSNFPVVGGISRTMCTFSTSTVGQTVASVTWWHNVNQPITSSSGDGGRISISTNIEEGESELTIRPVEESDAGDYTCKVEFTNPTQQKADTVELQVASVLNVEAEAEQTAIKGEMAVLVCNVTSIPPPAMEWYRVVPGMDDILLVAYIDTDDHQNEEDFGVYRIEIADESHSGTYRCQGRYTYGEKSVEIELFVLTVPVIITDAEDVIVLYTDTIHLNCSATGVRDPTYRWLFDGEELLMNDRVEYDPENGDLIIEALSYDDGGSYTCIAETGAGVDYITHTVSITGPPEILLPDEELEMIVAENSVVEIKCPFRSLPLPDVTWRKIASDGKKEEINSLAGGFTIFSGNGSLLIWNVSQSQASLYDCILTNSHGSDNRSFILRVIELPYPPEGFSVVERGDYSVGLTWSPPLTTHIKPVYQYILELTYEEIRGNISSTRTIPNSVTSYLADDLVPGVLYSLVLRSSNIAGVSIPTLPLTHTTASAAPKLEFFTAESLGDGYSILLQWRLHYSGGHDVNTFFIEVIVNDLLVDVLRPDVYDEQLLLDDLQPTREYHFKSVVGNAVDEAVPLYANATTPIAAPSKPSTPELDESSLQTLTISFSLKSGSFPIIYYLLKIINVDHFNTDTTNTTNATNTTDATNTTNSTITQEDIGRVVNITSGDVDYIKNEDMTIAADGEVVGYNVKLRVRDLSQGEEYVFSVAAANTVGLGEYSDFSDPFSLEDDVVLYLIVGGVVGGFILFVILLVVGLFICSCLRRRHRGGKMTITRRGSDSTGVATDYNLKFEPFNGGSYPRTTSPNASQIGVDSITPPPGRVNSPHVTSPYLTTQHYYNSLKKYQLDTLPASGGGPRGDSERVVEVQIHSNVHSNGGINGKKSESDLIDSGHYSRPTSHIPLQLSSSSSSQPPPFQPPPSITTSSIIPPLSSSSKLHPSYTHPTSHPLYNTPRNSNNATQVSMSALPTSSSGDVIVDSGSNTLPRASYDEYTFMSAQGTVGGRNGSMTVGDVGGRRFNSMILDEKHIMVDKSKRASYQTDV